VSTRAVEQAGEKLNERVIGGTINGRRGQPDYESAVADSCEACLWGTRNDSDVDEDPTLGIDRQGKRVSCLLFVHPRTHRAPVPPPPPDRLAADDGAEPSRQDDSALVRG
jgi:hypothetical protein